MLKTWQAAGFAAIAVLAAWLGPHVADVRERMADAARAQFLMPGERARPGTIQCKQVPAVTGDVVIGPRSCASAIAANAVTNAKLNTMGAWAIKGNNTSGAANPTDFTIDGLTLKASPASGDEIWIWDVAGAAWKKTTVGAIGSVGSVASLNGLTGALNIVAGTGISVSAAGSSITINAQITGGATTGASHAFSNSDCGNLVVRSNAGSVMTDTLPSTALQNGCVLYIINEDASAFYGLQTSGTPIFNGVANGFLLLGPQQSMTVESNGANYRAISPAARARLAPGTSLSLFYSGGTCSNTANMGLTSGAPWCDPQFCVNFIQANLDIGNNKGAAGFICQQVDSTVTASNSQGGASAGLNFSGNVSGHNTVVGITIQGNCTTPANTVLHPTAGSVVILDDYANLDVKCLTVQVGTSNAPVFVAQHNAFLVVDDKVTVTGGASTGDIMRAQDDGHILQQGTLTITGGSGGAIGSAQEHSLLEAGGTIALSGTTNFAETWAVGDSSAIAATPTYTGTGSATITNKYVLANGGFLNTGGNCVSVPGTGTSVDAFSNCH